MSEKSEIKRDGATAVKNSGRGKIRKGDSRLGPFTVDYKEYPKGYSVNQDNWRKICMDAFRNNQSIPTLKIVLGSGNDKTRLFVVGEDMFMEMLEAWEEKYDSGE